MNTYNHTTNSQQAQQRATSSQNDGMMIVRGKDYRYALKALLDGIPHLKCRIKNLTKPHIQNASNDHQMKNTLTSSNHQGYYKDLSKTISGLSNRYKLTFFVPKVCLASQAIKRLSTKQFTQYLPLQGKTVISMVSNLSPSYNGLTLQNKIAFRRICRAVTNSTESKTRYPMFFHSVALTQKLLGGL